MLQQRQKSSSALEGEYKQREEGVCIAASLLPHAILEGTRTDSETPQPSAEFDWKREIDPDLRVVVTPRTLLQLKQYHGSLVKVSNGTANCKSRIVRVLATPNLGLKDGVVYVSPLLAFNLQLQLHLLQHLTSEDSDQVEASSVCHSHPSLAGTDQLQGRLDSPDTGALVYIASCEAAQPSIGDQPQVALIQQAGCQSAVVRIATSVTIAKIRQPQNNILASPTLKLAESQPHDAHASPEALLQGKREEPQKSWNQQEMLPNQSEEEIVDALQGYLGAKHRLLAVGDVFAIPLADSSGERQMLKTLYSASDMADELAFFKVITMTPDWDSSMLVDAAQTAVVFTGTCNSFLPPVPTDVALCCRREVKGVVIEQEGWPKNGVTLLPLWRSLAAILAPLLHPVVQQVELKTAVLLEGASGSGKFTASQAAAGSLGVHLVPFSCRELRGLTDLKTGAALKAAFQVAREYAPALLLLRDVPALLEASPSGSLENGAVRLAGCLSECLSHSQHDPYRILVVGTTDSAADVAGALRRCFTHELTAEAPNLSQRQNLLSGILPRCLLGNTQVESIAQQTAGLLPADLSSLVADAAVTALARKADVQSLLNSFSSTSSGRSLEAPPVDLVVEIEMSDLDAALDGVHKRTAAAIGAPQVPNVRWEDVGGLEEIKAAILETIELPLKHPELFASGLRRRSGLLLYGPPGTGKTLVAKAVATECSINFLSVKGPELINMYIGESERQVREIFERARRARPCVLFFDELDSLAPARGAGADSGGVMDRVVSQLLAEVDGLQGTANAVASAASSSQDVFLIGATNRPDLLDGALMRPGRLDKLLYVGVAQQAADKFKVLTALTRKFCLASSVDLEVLAAACPPLLTGADLYALCADAWMVALRRCTSGENKEGATNDVEVEQEDFRQALSELTPSLSQEELARYQAIREKYQDT